MTTPRLAATTAAGIHPGDVILYTAGQWWTVVSISPTGKSVDVGYRVSQDAADPGSHGTLGEHRFRQSTNLLVIRTHDGFDDAPFTMFASDLEPGHVVHVNAKQSWRIGSVDLVGKSADVVFTVIRDSEDRTAVGVEGVHRFRQSTYLLVGDTSAAKNEPTAGSELGEDTTPDDGTFAQYL